MRNPQMSVRPRKFLVVGVTGGLASGKSSLCSALAARGARVVDLDQISREVTTRGSTTVRRLASAFGKSILTRSGEVDRRKLAEVAFSSPENVRTLNKLTHPPIIKALTEKLEGLAASGYDGIVAVEAALFVEEGGARDLIDVLVAVTCRDSTRRRRLSRLGEAEASTLMRRRLSQLSDEGKAEEADYVIENDGTLDDLMARSERLWDLLMAEKDRIVRDSEEVRGD